jgi:hypothetical protein
LPQIPLSYLPVSPKTVSLYQWSNPLGEARLSWILVGSVIDANMGFKLFVALQLEVARHFIERFALRSTRRFEPPSTFGATKTPKTWQLDPYQRPAQGHLYRCSNLYQLGVKRIKIAV